MGQARQAYDGKLYDTINLGRAYREDGEEGLAIRTFKYLLSRISGQDDPFLYNLVLNELEISEKRIVLSSKPRQLGVNLTHRCNINCIMCFYPANPWDIPEKTVKEIEGYLPYLQRIFWQGGEPFVSPYFEGLFEKASAYINLRQTVVTNGLLIDGAWAERLVKSRVAVIYSVDGVTKETYEFIRKGGRFETLIDSLNTLNRRRHAHSEKTALSADFELIMQATIMGYNWRQVDRLPEFAREHGFGALNIIPIQNTTGPENIFLHKDKEALDYIARAIPRIKDECGRSGIKLFIQLPGVEGIPLEPGSEEKRDSGCRAKNGANMLCYWPWESLFMLHEGKIKPYGFCRNDAGWDLAENTLDQIWNNDQMQAYRRNIVENKYESFCDPRCYSGVLSDDLLGREIK